MHLHVHWTRVVGLETFFAVSVLQVLVLNISQKIMEKTTVFFHCMRPEIKTSHRIILPYLPQSPRIVTVVRQTPVFNGYLLLSKRAFPTCLALKKATQVLRFSGTMTGPVMSSRVHRSYSWDEDNNSGGHFK